MTRLACFAFRSVDSVGIRNNFAFAAQWLAYAHPCRRFGRALADKPTRLGADAIRYSFIVVDFHPLLPAGLPAHPTPKNIRIRLAARHAVFDQVRGRAWRPQA
jgi:hypothetical protein